MDPNTTLISIAMLTQVVAGKTYDTVAAEHGVTRTSVERRIKTLVRTLYREVGIDGLNHNEIAFVHRLRKCGAAITVALERYLPNLAPQPRHGGVLTDEEIGLAVHRTRVRSTCPHRDVALFYILLSTGARPLEVARLEVRDYLNANGSVREESVMRKEVAVNGNARPLFFASRNTVEAINGYLAVRLRLDAGHATSSRYRGFAPNSRLFLTEAGAPFEIVGHGGPRHTRFLCRGIL